MSCSEPTDDSFMVNFTVAQLPGHSRGTRFYSRLPPPLGAATEYQNANKSDKSSVKMKLASSKYDYQWKHEYVVVEQQQRSVTESSL